MSKRKLEKSVMRCGGNVPVVASIIVLVAFIAGLLLGTLVVAKSYSGGSISALISPMTGSFADGYNAAKKKLADSGFFGRQMTGSLSGQITKVSGNEVTFTAPLVNPLDDESLKTRTAVADDKTTITLYRQKTADQITADQKAGQTETADAQSQIASFQKQLNKCGPGGTSSNTADCQKIYDDYNAAMQKLNDARALMDNFAKVDNAKLSDLQAGMQITVYGAEIKQAANQPAAPMPPAGNFTDISEQAKFTASQIIAREMPAAPAAPGIPAAPAAPVTPVK